MSWWERWLHRASDAYRYVPDQAEIDCDTRQVEVTLAEPPDVLRAPLDATEARCAHAACPLWFASPDHVAYPYQATLEGHFAEQGTPYVQQRPQPSGWAERRVPARPCAPLLSARLESTG